MLGTIRSKTIPTSPPFQNEAPFRSLTLWCVFAVFNMQMQLLYFSCYHMENLKWKTARNHILIYFSNNKEGEKNHYFPYRERILLTKSFFPGRERILLTKLFSPGRERMVFLSRLVKNFVKLKSFHRKMLSFEHFHVKIDNFRCFHDFFWLII